MWEYDTFQELRLERSVETHATLLHLRCIGGVLNLGSVTSQTSVETERYPELKVVDILEIPP